MVRKNKLPQMQLWFINNFDYANSERLPINFSFMIPICLATYLDHVSSCSFRGK